MTPDTATQNTMAATPKPSPFPTVPRKQRRGVDPSRLTIERGTPIPSTIQTNGKYDALFARMKPGDCVRCQPHEREHVCNALGKYIKRKGLAARVRSVMRCEDGHARVWLHPTTTTTERTK